MPIAGYGLQARYKLIFQIISLDLNQAVDMFSAVMIFSLASNIITI